MSTEIPSIDEVLSTVTVVDLPLITGFRGLRHRELLFIKGPHGPGEWAAFSEYGDEEASWWLAAALEQAFHPTPIAGSTSVAVNAIVPAMPAPDVAEWLTRFSGCTTIKVKVGESGQTPSDDLDRLHAVVDAAGSDVRLRLDANGAWDIDQAEAILKQCSDFDIDYVEQPVSTPEELSALRNRLGGLPIRFAADELVRKTHQLDHLSPELTEVIIIKPSPLGGFAYSIGLAREALSRGFDVTVSSGLESSVGLHHATLVAASVNELTGKDTAHGLGTGVLFDADVVESPLLPRGGRVTYQEPRLNETLLNDSKASQERTEWWQERFRRCVPLATEILNQRPE